MIEFILMFSVFYLLCTQVYSICIDNMSLFVTKKKMQPKFLEIVISSSFMTILRSRTYFRLISMSISYQSNVTFTFFTFITVLISCLVSPSELLGMIYIYCQFIYF